MLRSPSLTITGRDVEGVSARFFLRAALFATISLAGLGCGSRHGAEGTLDAPGQIHDSTDAQTRTTTLASSGGIALHGEDLIYWGYHRFGPQGNSLSDPHPTMIPAGVSLATIGAAENLVCGLLSTGGVSCYGGDAGPFASSTWVPLQGTEHAVEVSVGGAHACALDADGTVICWGRGANGQLGNGYVDGSMFVRVGNPGDFRSVIAGARGTCAIRTDGTTMCWGDGFSEFPAPVWPGVQPDQIAVGGIEGTTFVCGRFGTSVRCTHGGSGIFGEPSADANVLEDVVTLGAGGYEVCGNRASGEVTCWGSHSVIGHPSSSIPHLTNIVGLPLFTEPLSKLGDNYSCGLANNVVYCWGSNSLGQLGQGDTATRPLDQAFMLSF